jgi:hypothetical protein
MTAFALTRVGAVFVPWSSFPPSVYKFGLLRL